MVQYLHFFVLRVLRYLILPYILCVVNFFGQIGAAQRRISAFFTKTPPGFVENKQKGRAYDTDGSAWGELLQCSRGNRFDKAETFGCLSLLTK
jgi:hypothetical protein